MPVYRLTPVKGSEMNPQWRASSMRPYCLWVRAEDEDDARLQVAKATSLMPGDTAEEAPWKDSGLVACEYDDTKSLAEGIIYVRRSAGNTPQAENPQ